MSDLKLSTNATDGSDMTGMSGEVKPRKKSGCGCFAIGCLVLVLLFSAPFVGVGIWVATMDDAEWGEKLVSITQMEGFSEGFKAAIQENPDINAEAKKAIIDAYDTFATKYPNLPEEKKKKISENLIKLIKRAIFSPDTLAGGNAPDELVEIVEIFDPNAANLLKGVPATGTSTSTQTSIITTPPVSTNTAIATGQMTTTAVATSTATSDPFSFDLPSTTGTKTGSATATSTGGASPFDF